jgi:hypothetical protein
MHDVDDSRRNVRGAWGDMMTEVLRSVKRDPTVPVLVPSANESEILTVANLALTLG